MFRASLISAVVLYSILSGPHFRSDGLTPQATILLASRPYGFMTPPPLSLKIAPPEEEQSKTDIFSELTLFLFGSGVALFVALLGWSDQIRGINNDTREIETRFLDATQIDKSVFLSIVRPKTPDEQLVALTEILVSKKPRTAAAVEVLPIFQEWHQKWTSLESLSAWKYRLSVYLTYTLFASGFLSALVNPNIVVSAYYFHARMIFFILVIPMAGFLVILTIVAVANYKESHFRELLNLLSEKV